MINASVSTGSNTALNIHFQLAGLTAASDPTFLPVQDLANGSDAVKPGIVHYAGFVPVTALPTDLPNRPNLRDTNLKSPVSKDVKASLDANDGEFHLKNKGITVVASSVAVVSPGVVEVAIDAASDDGILDGGHTYKIIQSSIAEGVSLGKQYVWLAVRVNVAGALRAKMAEGLNKTTAVSSASLANRLGEFEWLKSLLPESATARVAWRQNDKRDVKADELIAELYAVNAYTSDPHVAYGSRAKALSALRADRSKFDSHAALSYDALKLYERIQHHFADWALKNLSKRAIESRSAKLTTGPVFDESLSKRYDKLARGVALPILSAFRACVVDLNPGYGFDRTYEDLCALLEAATPALQAQLTELWSRADIAGDPGAFGKKADVWESLSLVLEAAVAAQPPAVAVQAPQASSTAATLFAGSISADEVVSMWQDQLDEAEMYQEALAEEMRSAEQDEKTGLIEAIRAKNPEISSLRAAIEHAQAGKLGVCGKCGSSVEELRAIDAPTACLCSVCA
jgi:RNA polymerase-binding transcription factor DksA